MSLTPPPVPSTVLPSRLGSPSEGHVAMLLKRTIGLVGALAVATTLAACGGSNSSSTGAASYGDCKITSKANSIDVKPVKSDTLTVETTLPADGWWNGTTPQSIKS